jgi:cell division protein FtsA
MAKNYLLTALDIGTSSIKTLVVQKSPNSSEIEVISQLAEPSFGVRRGVVVDIEEVARRISKIFSQIENSISQKIRSVFVNISGSHLFCTTSRGLVSVSRADQKISKEDIERVLQAAQAFSLPQNREIIDIFPKEFSIDGEKGQKEVLGMKGVRLEAEVLAIGAFSPYLKNLTEAVLAANLQIEDLIPSPLASARSVLTLQQKELGVACLDIGAGKSDLAVFEEGDLIHLACFPIGSAHITNDLAIGLQTEIEIAEKIKREFGSCLFQGGRKKYSLEIPNENSPLVFSQKMLTKIIEARVSEIFELVQKELKKISPPSKLPAGLVLTGGGAKLAKIVDFGKKVLKLPVRIGRPKGFLGLDKDLEFATACGLVLAGVDLIEKKSSISQGIGQKLKRIFRVFLP